MAYFLFKTFVTASLIAGISEISKKFTFLASILAAIPLTSVLIFIWIYVEQKDVTKISLMSKEIFFLVLPSLAFFLILPILIKQGMNFYGALILDIVITFAIYYVYMKLMTKFIVKY